MEWTDYEVAKALHGHQFRRVTACDKLIHPADGECNCGWLERVQNTFLVLRAIRLAERKDCEAIARVSGGARAADMIRDRDKDDDRR
jgi:hypothetical protein